MLSPLSRRKGWQILPFIYKTTARNILPQNTCPCTQPLITNRNLAGKTKESFIHKKSLKTIRYMRIRSIFLGSRETNGSLLRIICGEFFNFTFCFPFLDFSKFTSFFPFLFGVERMHYCWIQLLTWTDDHFHSL